MTDGRVLTVSVGRPRVVRAGDRETTTAIWKAPVEGPVAVSGVNLAGDEQANRKVHGGPDKAVYVYASEDTAWWERRLGRALGPGAFGENLTVEGVDVGGALVGERWAIGTTLLEVRQPRLPCAKLGLRFGDPAMVRAFAHAGRPGVYLAIVAPGELATGDPVRVLERPAHAVSVGLMADAFLRDRGRLAELLEAPGLPADWRAWVVEHLERAS